MSREVRPLVWKILNTASNRLGATRNDRQVLGYTNGVEDALELFAELLVNAVVLDNIDPDAHAIQEIINNLRPPEQVRDTA